MYRAAKSRGVSRPPGKRTVLSVKIGTRSDSKSEFSLALFAPARHQIVLDPEVIEYSRHDEIDQILDALGAVIKAGIGRKDDRTRTRELEHVLQVQGGKRRLARDENQLAAFLQRDVGRALDESVGQTCGDRGERAHGAGAEDHGVRGIRAGSDRRKP